MDIGAPELLLSEVTIAAGARAGQSAVAGSGIWSGLARLAILTPRIGSVSRVEAAGRQQISTRSSPRAESSACVMRDGAAVGREGTAPPRHRRGGTIALAALACMIWCLAGTALSGCAGLAGELEDAESDDAETRREAFEDIEERVRDWERRDGENAADREQLDAFLASRLQVERDSGIRAQIVSIALQGELPGAPALFQAALADRAWPVRHAAVRGIAESRPPNAEELLATTLRDKRDIFVRIEAAKAIGEIGAADWAAPLIDVIVDDAEDANLRYQAYRSAVKLTKSELPFVPERWKALQKEGTP